ncbi:Craniofacial development protein 1, partial [Stegodyphus mimosarum]
MMMSLSGSDDEDSDYVPSDDDLKNTKCAKRNFSEMVCNKELILSESTKSKTGKERISIESDEVSQMREKQRAESIWKNFINDVKDSSTTKKDINATTAEKSNDLQNVSNEVCNCAGKAVAKLKSVDRNSVQLRNPVLKVPTIKMKNVIMNKCDSFNVRSHLKLCRDLHFVIENFSKKRKMTTLQKSSYDWDLFKKSENIEDDLKIYNRGKRGYLEKQAFLQRSNIREFELEKKARISKAK